MGDARGVDHLHGLEFGALRAHLVEQPNSVAEQYGDEVDLELVEQSGPDELPDDVGTTAEDDIPVPCDRLGLRQGASMPSVTKL
jgi:hypothetical protein